MKNTLITGILLLLLLSTAAVFADFENPVYTSEFIAEQEQMLTRIEQLFPRPLLQYTYDGTNKPQVSKTEDGYYVYSRELQGKRERMIAVNQPKTEDKGWGDTSFNTTGSYENFYISVEAQLIERDDSRQGYLWIQYTNGDIVGSSNRDAVEIDFPFSIRKYESVGENRNYTTLYDISEYGNDFQVHRFEILRLNGRASFFIDRKFITSFEDGFSGRFYPIFGSGLREGGLYATAQFDNFIFRVK